MKNKIDFFHLRYPDPIAEVCCFFQLKRGVFLDLPLILPSGFETLEYENTDEIVFNDVKYAKLNEMSKVKLRFKLQEKKFYWGVINVGNEKKSQFLVWVKLNGCTEDIVTPIMSKEGFSIRMEDGNEGFTILWSA